MPDKTFFLLVQLLPCVISVPGSSEYLLDNLDTLLISLDRLPKTIISCVKAISASALKILQILLQHDPEEHKRKLGSSSLIQIDSVNTFADLG